MNYQASIPISFDADNEEEASERLEEIFSTIDWSYVPETYNVLIEDAHITGFDGEDPPEDDDKDDK